MFNIQYSSIFLFLLISLLVVCGVSLLFGESVSSPTVLLRWIFGHASPIEHLIFYEIRSPRVVLATCIGFSLGLSGAVIQGLLRNPLAEPSLFGASNSAALGAVIMIYIGLNDHVSYAVSLAATIGALLSVAVLFGLLGKQLDSIRLILAGFAISAFSGAGIALALNLSQDLFAVVEISFWLLGSVENRSWQHVTIALPLIIIGSILLLWDKRLLDAMTLGEETAMTLGVRFRILQIRLAIGIAFVIGGAVSVAGVIGFIGLIAPHFVRGFVGGVTSRSLWLSGFVGALLLVVADTFIRIIPTHTELKLGVVTAFIGVPIFILLLFRGYYTRNIRS